MLAGTDAHGNTTTYAYDLRGNLLRATDSARQVRPAYVYDRSANDAIAVDGCDRADDSVRV